jgi:hypothetical protein
VHNILLHIRKVKHPPTNKFTGLPPPLVPPLSRNSKIRLFHHLQQHGFENPEYGVYFCKSYPTKEKTLKDMLACGIQGKAYQGSMTLFAEMLTNSGSLKSNLIIMLSHYLYLDFFISLFRHLAYTSHLLSPLQFTGLLRVSQ